MSGEAKSSFIIRRVDRFDFRCVRHDISLSLFCQFLMTSQLKERFDHFKEFEFKERMFTSLVDLITQAIFLTITPQVTF